MLHSWNSQLNVGREDFGARSGCVGFMAFV